MIDIPMMWGVQVRVGEPGTQFTGPDGEVLTLEKGEGVQNGRTLWLVRSDYDAMKRAVPSARTARPAR